MQKSFFEIAKDPTFWEKVRTEECYQPIRDNLLKKWDDLGKGPIQALKFSEFKLFFDTGDREIYQAQYFRHRQILSEAACLSLIYPDNREYLERLEDIIFAICGEYTWCLPAHYPSVDADVFDHLDLFACETGSAFGEIDYFLGERLSPLIRTMLRKETQRRIIDPYCSGRAFWWQHGRNNWAAVCTGSTAIAVWTLRPDIFPQLVPRFRDSMEYFLSGYGEDGFCLEGLGYWHYGFGYFLFYADLERYAMKGKTEDWFKRPKVKEIATYAQKMIINGGNVTVSFSDGHPTGGQKKAIMHYLRHEYGDAIALIPTDNPDLASGCARFCGDTRAIVWFDPELGIDPVPEQVSYYAKDAEWWLVKTPKYGFAAKAGNNGEPHNHNDVGNFIIAKDGRQIFADLGAGLYSRQYFNEERYTFFHTASFGHSVPFFGTLKQQAGKEHAAHSVTLEGNRFSFEFADAYGEDEKIGSVDKYTGIISSEKNADSPLKKLNRTFEINSDLILISDTFDYTGTSPITERFVVKDEPTALENGFSVGGLVCTTNTKGVEVKISKVKFEFENNHKASDTWTVDLILAPTEKDFKLEIKFPQ